MEVNNFIELESALANQEPIILLKRSMMATHSFILPPKTKLQGIVQENGALPLLMFEHTDGVGVTAENQIQDLNIQVPSQQKAIFSAGYVKNLGHFEFKNLKLNGQFSFIMRKGSQTADLNLDSIHILSSDTRGYLEQPQKYGVNVLQGALTVYNFNPSINSLITLKATNISIGQTDSPVTGSGVFIAGFGDNGGRVEIEELQTNNVYSTGRIPFGVANLITAAIFIVNGVYAKKVIHLGETVTYGVNDMVLDTWGKVDHWLVNGPIISYGPSGIGFVNFGVVKYFESHAPIETYGLGARGYNQYDGTLEKGLFQAIRTYGNGSVGVQVSRQVGSITIENGIQTQGGVGNSLVKGVNIELPAYALSVKPGGEITNLTVIGDISTFGDEVATIQVENGGVIKQLNITGEIKATGKNSQLYDVTDKALLKQLKQ